MFVQSMKLLEYLCLSYVVWYNCIMSVSGSDGATEAEEWELKYNA